jgi:hypothetical protein
MFKYFRFGDFTSLNDPVTTLSLLLFLSSHSPTLTMPISSSSRTSLISLSSFTKKAHLSTMNYPTSHTVFGPLFSQSTISPQEVFSIPFPQMMRPSRTSPLILTFSAEEKIVLLILNQLVLKILNPM